MKKLLLFSLTIFILIHPHSAMAQLPNEKTALPNAKTQLQKNQKCEQSLEVKGSLTKEPLTKEQLAELEKQKQEELKIREQLIPEIRTRLTDSTSSEELLSRVNYQALRSIYQSKRTVTVLTGDFEVERNREAILRLIEKAVRKNNFVIYDADSTFADLIKATAKDKAVGITANIQKQNYDENVFCIPSVYFRLKAFRSSAKVFATRSSVAGIAVLIDGGVDAVIDESASSYDLRTWRYETSIIKRNLNLKFEPVLVSLNEDLLFGKQKKFKKDLPEINSPLDFAYFDSEGLKELLRNYDFMLQQDQLMKDFAGVVIFGSALYDKKSIPKNYEIAYFLSSQGVPVTTGGAGGAMKVANTGAYDAGGVSIGIPIEGRNQLRLETKVASKVHTTTISTLNHGERIPLLLDHKELVIAVPGGSGTMQEIAVTLMKMQEQPQSSFQLILVDRSYYAGLYGWIRNQNLPESILSRIHLVEDSAEFKMLFAKLIDEKKIDPAKLFTQEKPQAARNKRTSFKPKLIAIEDFFDKLLNKIFGSKK